MTGQGISCAHHLSQFYKKKMISQILITSGNICGFNNVHFSLTLISSKKEMRKMMYVTLTKNFKGVLCMLSNVSSLQIFLCPQRNFGRHIVIALSVRQSVSPSRFRVRSISPILFEVGIPKLVCKYISKWRSVTYHFRVIVTLTLTSDLVFRIIVSGAYLLYYLR